MSEWHVTPDYIVNNWSDELLALMTDKLVERKLQTSKPENKKEVTAVSEKSFFKTAGIVHKGV